MLSYLCISLQGWHPYHHHLDLHAFSSLDSSSVQQGQRETNITHRKTFLYTSQFCRRMWNTNTYSFDSSLFKYIIHFSIWRKIWIWLHCGLLQLKMWAIHLNKDDYVPPFVLQSSSSFSSLMISLPSDVILNPCSVLQAFFRLGLVATYIVKKKAI